MTGGERSLVRGRADCVGLGVYARGKALALGWDKRRAEELSLVVIELTNNSVRHASGGRVELEIAEARAALAVQDEGPGFPVWILDRHRRGEPFELAPATSARGLGAGLDSARRLSDELRLDNVPGGGARVRCVLGPRTREGRAT